MMRRLKPLVFVGFTAFSLIIGVLSQVDKASASPYMTSPLCAAQSKVTLKKTVPVTMTAAGKTTTLASVMVYETVRRDSTGVIRTNFCARISTGNASVTALDVSIKATSTGTVRSVHTDRENAAPTTTTTAAPPTVPTIAVASRPTTAANNAPSAPAPLTTTAQPAEALADAITVDIEQSGSTPADDAPLQGLDDADPGIGSATDLPLTTAVDDNTTVLSATDVATPPVTSADTSATTSAIESLDSPATGSSALPVAKPVAPSAPNVLTRAPVVISASASIGAKKYPMTNITQGALPGAGGRTPVVNYTGTQTDWACTFGSPAYATVITLASRRPADNCWARSGGVTTAVNRATFLNTVKAPAVSAALTNNIYAGWNINALAGGRNIALVWEAASAPTYSTYAVYRNGVRIGTVNWKKPPSDQQTTVRFVDRTAKGNTTYWYRIATLDGAGAVRGWSSPVTGTLPTGQTATPTVTTKLVSSNATVNANVRQAKAMVETWYPILANKMVAPNASVPSNITITSTRLPADDPVVAYVMGTTMTLNETMILRGMTGVNGVVIHEMTHIMQPLGNRNAIWLMEGLADYNRINVYRDALLYYPSSATSYRNGYNDAAYLIDYVSRHYKKPQLARDLSIALKRGTYTDAMWQKQTGKTLAQLGKEAYTLPY